MAGHTSPPQEQEQEAERRLLDLHSRLWGLATELLLLPTEQGGDDDHPSQRSSPRPRPPLAIIEDIKRCRAEADAFWAGRRDGESGADGAADEERAEEANRRKLKGQQQQQQLVARLRARLLGRTTEAFADELDALRTSDGTFKGTEEDVRGLVAILEEGAEALLAEGDGATLGVYHDHLLGEGDDDEEQSAEILDEPVHVRVRREKGMLLASSSRLTNAVSAAAEDAMEESSEGGGS